MQLSELEQFRVKKLAHRFNTAAQDSNPGSRGRESEALPLSHCALRLLVSWYICLYRMFTTVCTMVKVIQVNGKV